MKPKKPQELYQITAKKLNLPEQYVKDAVEFFYESFKNEMFDLSHVIINNSGLGRFIIKPIPFLKRELLLMDLVEKFNDRGDDRGIMIRKELERRLENFQKIKPEVENLQDYIIKQRYGRKIKNDLEKQKKNH